jgi:hypothetical protein
MLAVPSFLGVLPVQGGVSFDVDSLVGLVIVFFAVVWPVIRGLLNVAKSNRQDFQARSGSDSSRSNALEAFLEGLREEEDDDDEEADGLRRAAARARRRREQREEELAAQRARRERAMEAARSDPFEASQGEVAEATVQETPKERPSVLAPSRGGREGRGRGPTKRFEVAIDGDLDEIPSEDALEADLLARPKPERRAEPEREPDEEGLEVLSGAGERAAFALDSEQASPLDRIQAGRSPWRSAILMKEILGPPISVKPHDDQLL